MKFSPGIYSIGTKANELDTHLVRRRGTGFAGCYPLILKSPYILAIPVAMGIWVMLVGHAPMMRIGIQLLACLLGLIVYKIAVSSRLRLTPSVSTILILVGLAVLSSTLLTPGIDQVRRWHSLGGLRLHPSAILAPLLLLQAESRISTHPWQAHGLLLFAQVLHVLQPDAGQASALGAGALVLTFVGHRRLAPRITLILLYLASIAAAWLRPDSLPPAPFVEDIVPRAFSYSVILGILTFCSLIPFILSPFLTAHSRPFSPPLRPAPFALSAYFAVSAAATLFGEFPVPLVGFGASPILGAYLGLAALERRLSGCFPSKSAL